MSLNIMERVPIALRKAGSDRFPVFGTRFRRRAEEGETGVVKCLEFLCKENKQKVTEMNLVLGFGC